MNTRRARAALFQPTNTPLETKMDGMLVDDFASFATLPLCELRPYRSYFYCMYSQSARTDTANAIGVHVSLSLRNFTKVRLPTCISDTQHFNQFI